MNTDHPLIANIARAERAMGSNPRSAVEQYDAIIAHARFGELDAPLRSACHLNRGFQQRILGRPHEAIADFEHAARHSPGTFKPHYSGLQPASWLQVCSLHQLSTVVKIRNTKNWVSTSCSGHWLWLWLARSSVTT